MPCNIGILRLKLAPLISVCEFQCNVIWQCLPFACGAVEKDLNPANDV